MEVKIDNKTYTVETTLGAIIRYEEVKNEGTFSEPKTVGDMALFIYCCLCSKYENFTDIVSFDKFIDSQDFDILNKYCAEMNKKKVMVK